ncbi:MAG: class I SAM-dependent methyltransferase [Deferrisomatales bacterium]
MARNDVKEKVDRLGALSQTLLLPLYFRARESRRADGLLRDDEAVRLVERLDFDFSRLEGHTVTQVATALRVREIDRLTCRFLRERPEGVVVHLGCGLDTRFHRLDNGRARWVDVDLPEVMDLRTRLLPPGPRVTPVAASVLDLSWVRRLPPAEPDAMLFVAEGLFPYLREEEVRRVLGGLHRRFPGARLLFDAVSRLQAAWSDAHPVLRVLGVRFRWGLDRGADLERWLPGVRVLRESRYLDRFEPRLGPLWWITALPPVAEGFRVIECALAAPGAAEKGGPRRPRG